MLNNTEKDKTTENTKFDVEKCLKTNILLNFVEIKFPHKFNLLLSLQQVGLTSLLKLDVLWKNTKAFPTKPSNS